MTTQNRTDLKNSWATTITDGGGNTAAEVRAVLDNAADSSLLKLGDSLTGVTVATNDLVVIMDVSDSNNLKTVTTQAVANLAPVPTTITMANEASDTTCFPVFSTATTGDLGPKTNASFTFNSSNAHLGAGAFIPSSSTVPTNGMYLSTTNTVAWACNSAVEMILNSTNLTPGANDGNALGSATVSWSDLFLASGGVINWNNGNMTLTHSAGNLTLSGGEFNTDISTTTVSATVGIDEAALLGQDVVTWTPSSNPNTTGVYITNRMRKTVVDVTNASITGTGISHAVAGYDYYLMQGNTNTIDLAFVHESKFKKTGTGTLNQLVFYKPAKDSISGTVNNIILFDGDMDLSGVTYTNAYLMYNPSRSYLKLLTAGQIIGASGNEVPTTFTPPPASGRYYFGQNFGTAGSGATTQGLLIAGPPVVIGERTTFTRIGIRVVTGVASSVARLGVYKMNSNGEPGTLVFDAGPVATATNNTDAEITISQTLEAGAYFLCYQSTGGASAATTKTFAWTDQELIKMYGNTSASPDSATVEDTIYVANTGTFPSTFGTPTRIRVGGGVPAVYLKR